MTPPVENASLTRWLSPAQLKSIAYYPRAKISLWEGAVSSGKTISSLWAFLDAVIKAPHNGLIVIVAKTLTTAYQNLFRPLQDRDLFGMMAEQVQYNRGAPSGRILGREVMVMGSADQKAISKIQGATVALAYVDEASLLPEGFWDMLITRLRVPKAKCIATTNPGAKNHPLRAKWILRAKDVGMQVFSFTMRDNPGLTQDYIRDMERSYTGIFYERFILGKWTNAEGAIFDMFDEKLHVISWKDLPPMQRMPAAGVDYGTSNAAAAGVLGWGSDNMLYICSEWRHDSREANEVRWTDAQLSHALLKWIPTAHTPRNTITSPEPPVEWLYVDPSAASLKVQLGYDGYNRVANADNDVVSGLRLISSLFAIGKLKIADTCTALLKEIPGYVWDPKATAAGLDKPIKKDDHSIDGALRYTIGSTQSIWARSILGKVSP